MASTEPVAAPRRAAHPVIVLISITVVFGMALVVLWQWLDTKAYVAADTVVAAAPPASALSTPVLSVRRAPATLSFAANEAPFVAALAPLVERVGSSSCLAVSVDGQRVAAVNDVAPVLPASTMKLVVAPVGLDVLGADFRYRTAVNASVGDGGVVAGDLVLVGGGDPVLTSKAWATNGFQRYPPIEITSAEALADSVRAAGVTRIDGSVVGDGSRYDDERFNPTWSAGIRVTEAGPIGGLVIDDGRSGGVVADDPALGAAQVFTRLLRDRGITVGGQPQARAGSAADGAPEIASIESAPLTAIVREMLETSDDNTAEMLVKELGVASAATGSTAAGLGVINARLAEWGVPTDGITLVDGSGLSRDGRLTCAALLTLLERDPVDGPVTQGLAVAAATGTLQPEFVGTAMAGVLRGKTGSLTDVKTLAGVVPAAGDVTIRFALLLNEAGINETTAYRPVWEQILAPALATYPSSATPDQLAPR